MSLDERAGAAAVRLLGALRRTPLATWVTLVVVGLSTMFVLWVVNPAGVLFTDTTPTGGDLGAHVWGPAFIRDELLPRFRLTGWTPDWYAGFPAFHFYMVVPMLAVVAVNVGLVMPLAVPVALAAVAGGVWLERRRPTGWIPGLWALGALIVLVVPVAYGIAFKWVTVAGLVAMPIAAWLMGRLAGLAFPGPALMAAATLPFIFDRAFNIMGGNLMSTMAGEFAFALAVVALLVYLGLLVRGIETGRGRGWAALALAVVGLCHLLVAFYALLASFVAVLTRPSRAAFIWLLTTGVVAGLTSAFWVLPFWWQRDHLNDMAWDKLGDSRSYLWNRGNLAADFLTNDPPLQVVIVTAGVGLLLSLVFRRRLGLILAAMVLVLAAAFTWLPEGRLYNGRLLPCYYLSLYLLAGIGVAEVLRLTGRLFDGFRGRNGSGGRWVTSGGAVAVLLYLTVYLGMPLRAMPFGSMDVNTYRWMGLGTEQLNLGRSWVNWNFAGYEARTGDDSGGGWDEYRDIVTTMSDVADANGCGRLLWEYSSELTRYGTPMALMLLPHWTDGCIGSMEGLYFEASTTTPYHFLMQSELSTGPSRAQRSLPYRSLDMDAGVDHMRQFGVRYYSPSSQRAINEARDHPDLTEVATTGPWTVFLVAGSDLVAPMAFEPVVFTDVDHSSWLDPSVEVFQEGSQAVQWTVGGLAAWQHLPSGEEPDERALEPVQISDIVTDVDSISFHVDRIGVPVIVRTSYFPNWEADGAAGPWRVTPNLMAVVPTGPDVTLTYGRTPVDIVSMLLSLLGLAGLFLLSRAPRPEEGPLPGPDLLSVGSDASAGLDAWVVGCAERRVAAREAHANLEHAPGDEVLTDDGDLPADEDLPGGWSVDIDEPPATVDEPGETA